MALQEVEEHAMRSTIEWGKLHPSGLQLPTRWSPGALEDAYKRCGTITADYAKTFYLVRLAFHTLSLADTIVCPINVAMLLLAYQPCNSTDIVLQMQPQLASSQLAVLDAEEAVSVLHRAQS